MRVLARIIFDEASVCLQEVENFLELANNILLISMKKEGQTAQQKLAQATPKVNE